MWEYFTKGSTLNPYNQAVSFNAFDAENDFLNYHGNKVSHAC